MTFLGMWNSPLINMHMHNAGTHYSALSGPPMVSLHSTKLDEWSADDLVPQPSENELFSTYAQLRLYIIMNNKKNHNYSITAE